MGDGNIFSGKEVKIILIIGALNKKKCGIAALFL